MTIQIKADGTVLLGALVSCDGFAYGRDFRVQTHLHEDHMVGFNTSKANQTILASEATRDLLCATKNADLPYRTNLVGVPFETPFQVGDDSVLLVNSGHMLGGAQVVVESRSGYRSGYSSDFFWPLDSVCAVDELLVDSTYGDPNSQREYHQSEIDARLLGAASASLRAGRQVAVIGHVGRLHTAMSLLTSHLPYPFGASKRAHKAIDTYRKYGWHIGDIYPDDSEDWKSLIRAQLPALYFLSLPERRHNTVVDRMAKITLSAYWTDKRNPLVDYGDGDCAIAYTDHADHEDTVRFVEATGAKRVWTDPRSGNAEALATALCKRLGICASPAVPITDRGWG